MLPDPAHCPWKPCQRWDSGAWCSPTVKAGRASGLGTDEHPGPHWVPSTGEGSSPAGDSQTFSESCSQQAPGQAILCTPRISGLSGIPNGVVLLKLTVSSGLPGRALAWAGVVYGWAAVFCVATIISLSLCLSHTIAHMVTQAGLVPWRACVEVPVGDQVTRCFLKQ